MTFQLTINNKLAVIMLDRGRSNAINHQMISELIICIQDLQQDVNVGGLIITGKPGFFSSGIDLIEAYEYDEEQSRSLWSDFLQLQRVLAGFSKPVVAAVSGHSPAGGCVLALCADYRVMAEGNFIIGLNEIPVGIIVPHSVFNLYAFWLGQRRAYQYLMEGKLLKVPEALEAGLVDETCAAESIMTVAERKIRTYMQLNPIAWSQSKLNLRRELITQLNADPTEALNSMLQQWWAPETRKGLQMLIENLKSKKS